MVTAKSSDAKLETATFAGGCFWCFETIFKQLKGVSSVQSGFAGGEGPIDYNTIHYQNNGYAESVHFNYNPNIIPYDVLLDIFWHLHNPTELNRQGYDVGKEYRSVIFYHSPKQHKLAEKSKSILEASNEFKKTIVTEIQPFTTFVKADEHHQNFYEKNKMNPYCMFIISPKLSKLREKYRKHVAK